MATPGGIPVRGKCRAGHWTSTVSQAGRVTWRGPCPHDGCVESVICRRIGRPDPPPDGADEVIDLTAPTKAVLPSGREIRKVVAWRDDDTSPAGPPGEPPGARGADGGPAGVQAPPAVADVEPVVAELPVEPEPVDEPEPRPRRRFGILSRADRDARADVVPGIYP